MISLALADPLYESTSSEEAMAIAKQKGIRVVLPKKNELLVDLDSYDAKEKFLKNASLLRVSDFDLKPSKTPGHYHATVRWFRPVTTQERIMLQLLLGSDSTRETHSYIRLGEGDPNPTLFFEEK